MVWASPWAGAVLRWPAAVWALMWAAASLLSAAQVFVLEYPWRRR